MVKNLPKKDAVYKQPTSRKLRYILDHTALSAYHNNDAHFIDLARDLSRLNRRLYRQGLVYAVKSITVHDTTANAWVKVNTLPDTYITRLAWIRAFRLWKKMNNQLDAKSVEGKWADFKVYYSQNHINQPGADIPQPIYAGDINTGGTINLRSLPSGEWEYTKMVTADPDRIDPDSDGGFEWDGSDADQFTLHMLGEHTLSADAGKYDSVGVISSYTTRHPQVQTAPVNDAGVNTDPLLNLFDSGDNHDDLLQNLEDDNDEPPYHDNVMLGEGSATTDGQGLQAVQVATSANSPIGRAGGFIAPLGLLEVVTRCDIDNRIEIVVELAEGDYMGVAAAAYL